MTGIMLNNAIDHDTAALLAGEFGFEVENVAFQEADVFAAGRRQAGGSRRRARRSSPSWATSTTARPRCSTPSATPTSRRAKRAASRSTSAPTRSRRADGNDVVFLDTPGHEAFTAMRARGAQATDIVVLVVAADDGVMPQTLEALNHAKDAEVPIIVAVNKIDKPGAQPERIRQQLSEHGLIPEAWGGETIYVDVSARTKAGIDQLLADDRAAVRGARAQGQSEQGWRAAPSSKPSSTATAVRWRRCWCRTARCKLGDTVVAGEYIGKVRAMLDDKGRTLERSRPVDAGRSARPRRACPRRARALNAVADEKQAKELVEHRRDRAPQEGARRAPPRCRSRTSSSASRRARSRSSRSSSRPTCRARPRRSRRRCIKLATEQVKVDVISAGVGGITETDVNLAQAPATRSSSASTCVRRARRSSSPSRRASTSSSTTSSTRRSTT